MKLKRWMIILLTVLLLLLTVSCGKDESDGGKDSEAVSSEVPVDIVSHVRSMVGEQQEFSWGDDKQKDNYSILLDGCSDQEAGYYLYDITGDQVLELMLGKDVMTVYSYNQGAVMTIGTLTVQKAWLSEQYGMLAYCENAGIYELRQYQYDGEMMIEKVLITAANTADYDNQAAGYLEGAWELERYELTDRMPFQ